jgi:hypothetical protein
MLDFWEEFSGPKISGPKYNGVLVLPILFMIPEQISNVKTFKHQCARSITCNAIEDK